MDETPANGTHGLGADVEMKDEPFPNGLSSNAPPQVTNSFSQQAGPPPVAMHAEHLSTIQPAAAPTPPGIAGANTRPSSMPPQPSARPEKPAVHGGPTRQYLNQNLTPHLLEGMKYLAVYEPEKPLLWLADFLRDRSKEVEGA